MQCFRIHVKFCSPELPVLLGSLIAHALVVVAQVMLQGGITTRPSEPQDFYFRLCSSMLASTEESIPSAVNS